MFYRQANAKADGLKIFKQIFPLIKTFNVTSKDKTRKQTNKKKVENFPFCVKKKKLKVSQHLSLTTSVSYFVRIDFLNLMQFVFEI